MANEITYRQLTNADAGLLRHFAGLTIHHPGDSATVGEAAADQPDIAQYWRGFGARPGDVGWLAESEGQPIGAAWARHLPDGYGYIADAVPELAVAIEPEHRGNGIGSALLERLFETLASIGAEALSLSVTPSNPALRLYQRLGFRLVAARGADLLMVKDLVEMPPPAPALPVMDFGPWEARNIKDIAAEVTSRATPGQRALVLVDGTGGSGKSTFAQALADHLPGGAIVVHTDDVSWWLHATDWAPQMLAGVVEPWLRGEQVDYRPPGWEAKGRPGSVQAAGPPGATLVVEGVGAVRSELIPYATYKVWVHTTPALAAERILARDIGTDGESRAEVAAFQPGWMAEEVPFHLAQRPWERADLIVSGEHRPRPNGDVAVSARTVR